MMATFVMDHGGWELFLSFFSAQARVIAVEHTGWSSAIHVEELASSFVWPLPTDGVMVTLEDPSGEDLQARIAELLEAARQVEDAEVQDTDSTKVVGNGAVHETRSWRLPGSLAPLRCTTCGGDAVRVLGIAETYRYIKHFAEKVQGKELGQRLSSHGVRWRIGKMDFDAFRCDECLSVCVNSPQAPGRAWTVNLEEA